MKKLSIFCLTLISVYQLSAQCDGRYQADIFANADVSTVQYGSNQDLNSTTINLTMDIYQPQGDTATNRPLIIFAHGGSFSAGTKNDADIVFFCTEMAKKGYVCASINYRLAPSAFSLIAEETTVKVVLMAIQDGKAAVRYFRQDAATSNTYKINPDQIFMGGTSAGGILGINLAYLDSTDTMSANWQNWSTQIGGLEGNSGNPGYCSYVNGTFGFAGGVADLNWINNNDVPWYGCHAETDNTVKIGYGQPLNGFTPVFLYGSDSINGRLNSLGIHASYDRYTGGNHPPFNGNSTIMANNKDSLATFLYRILDCNPNNLQLPIQKTCNSTVGLAELTTNAIEAKIYPNPFNNQITVELNNKYALNNTRISVINSIGEVLTDQAATSYINTISLNNLAQGVYFVKISSPEGASTQLIVKQ
ncbi:MAG: T9SS type A sorting domain-containing protein [Flavobacteriales bacterium]